MVVKNNTIYVLKKDLPFAKVGAAFYKEDDEWCMKQSLDATQVYQFDAYGPIWLLDVYCNDKKWFEAFEIRTKV